jgi:hypothetical protein
MVFRIITGVVASVVAGVVARVVTGGDEVYKHHSSARVLTLTSVATRFISPAMSPERLLAFLTSLLNSQQRQKACWYTI